MNYLAIDTSSKHLTVAAVKGGRAEVRYLPDCAMRHSVLLMGEIEAALDGLQLLPAECDFFCAVTGPGSFTGIRIGISAAKGFAMGTGKPLLPLTAFEMVAYNVIGADEFVVAVDAARGHYYAQKFTPQGAGQPAYISGEELAGYGLPVYGYEELSLPMYTKVDAQTALKTAVERKLADRAPFGGMTALYVRKSQAEEGRA